MRFHALFLAAGVAALLTVDAVLLTTAVRAAETVKVIPSDLFTEGRFGRSVAVDRDRMIVGAPRRAGFDTQGGVAWIYRLEQGVWVEEARLMSAVSSSTDQFGFAVDLEGDRAVIGAWGWELGGFRLGEVSIYERQATGPVPWVRVETLGPEGAQLNTRFGMSLSLDGERLAVGAPGIEPVYNQLDDSVYLFERQADGTWAQVERLRAEDTLYREFGAAVALEGPQLLVGAPLDASGGGGRVYAFAESAGTWRQEAVLQNSSGQAQDRFGDVVALDADRAAIGAPRALTGGSVELFARIAPGDWEPLLRLVPDHLSAAAQFGDAVGFGRAFSAPSTTASGLLIGAPNDRIAGVRAGSVYLYVDRGGNGTDWQLRARLADPDAQGGEQFGSAVAGHPLRQQIAVGAPRADAQGGANTGAVYVTVP